MFTRFLFCLPLIASFTAALAQDAVTVRPPPPPPPPPPNSSCDCCAAKPQYQSAAWAPFTGTVAVVTQQHNSDPGPLASQVVVIWDLHIKNGAPLDTWWNPPGSSPQSVPPTQYYSDPSWNVGNLGDVFGATLDGSGNIYVAATTSYGSANIGSLAVPSTNTPLQKAGQIYKIANGTGVPAAFVQLPNNGNGLGNLYYDCEFNSLYATNFYDGLIYRMNAAGVIQPIQWDHGLNLPSAVDAAGNLLGRPAITGKDGSSSYTALGRRVWAVTVYKNRLWYSVWDNDMSHNNGIANEIWSVALDVNGDPMAPARLEIALPPYQGTWSSPVSDMRFGPMGTLMLAERSMYGNNSPTAHESRALEYSFNGTAWVLPNPSAYKIGSIAGNIGAYTNSAGGVDFDFSPQGRTWVSGDALLFTTGDFVYGIQGFPPGGGAVANSILVDNDDYVVQQNKTQIGVVRIPCPDCTNPATPPVVVGPQSTCVSPSHYSVTPQAGVTYTWTVTGGTPSATTGSAINVNWTGGPGTITVTTSGPGKCGAVSTFVSVAACSTTCQFCSQFKTSLALATPVPVNATGLQQVIPTVTSNMPGVLGITTTLLSTSVGYSPASCGVAGPLASYIPLASPSSNPGLNPPLLPVPNGNQAIWSASSAVNLTSATTTPFMLQLPKPPAVGPACSVNFSLCLKVSLNTATCQTCDQMQCFGPFPYTTVAFPINVQGTGDANPSNVLPLVLPDGTTSLVPDGSTPSPAPR
jgi:hypothetical protein